jgi:hypothetical protein
VEQHSTAAYRPTARPESAPAADTPVIEEIKPFLPPRPVIKPLAAPEEELDVPDFLK